MRRLLAFLAVAALSIVSTASAGPTFGLRLGLTESRLHGEYGDLFGYKLRAGGAAGLHGSFALSRAFAIEPELWWVTKGARSRNTLTFTGTSYPEPEIFRFEVDHSIPYIELPVLLRFEPISRRSWGAYLIGGPSVAVRVGGDLDIEFEDDPAAPLQGDPHIQAADIFEDVGTFDDPNYRRWDWGAAAGGGVAINHGNWRSVVEVRYSRGFTNVLPSGIGSPNSVLTLALGFDWR